MLEAVFLYSRSGKQGSIKEPRTSFLIHAMAETNHPRVQGENSTLKIFLASRFFHIHLHASLDKGSGKRGGGCEIGYRA